MKKISEIIILFFLLFTFFSCRENPSEVGNNILSQTDSIATITFDSRIAGVIPDQEMIKRKTVILPSANNILINGKYNGYEAFSILWFNDVRDTVVNSTIIKAEIVLNVDNVFLGNRNQQSLLLHKVQKIANNSNMDVSTIYTLLSATTSSRDVLSGSGILLDENVRTVYSGEIKPNTELSIPIDSGFAKELLYGVNYGESVPSGLVFLTNIGSNTISSFSSSSADSVKRPYLRIIRLNGSVTDTITLRNISDESVIFSGSSSGYYKVNNLYCGLGYRTRLKFDVSKIPSNVIINKAILTLTLDSSISKLDYTYGADSLRLISIADSANLTNDESITTMSKPSEDGTKKYTFDIAPLVQKWILGQTNYGFEIYPYYEYFTLKVFGFHNPVIFNNNLSPRLEIKYFLPPK